MMGILPHNGHITGGEILLSDAETGEELAVIECSSVTSLRTGAAAAVSAQALARDDAIPQECRRVLGQERPRIRERVGAERVEPQRLLPGMPRQRASGLL